MPRTVDPQRHEARRLHIIDAALTAFAETGFEKTTTAAICRTAGIGSGTFFHYFPTKAAVLVAILELGALETEQWFASQQGRADPLAVLADFFDRTATEATDPRMAGFVVAVLAVVGQPDVSAALAVDEAATKRGLLGWVTQAQQRALIRTDFSPERVTRWLFLLVDGFLSRVATDPSFNAEVEGPALWDVAQRFLRP